MSVVIRAASAADVDAVVRLERGSGAPHWSALDYLAIFSGVGPQRCLLVAEVAGALVGFAVGKVLLGEAELETVAVAAEARRGGIGRRLCCAVKAWCEAQGAELMEIEVRAGNIGAITLYAEMGLVEVGRRPGYYRDPMEDAVLMRMELRQAEEKALCQ